jgi:ribosomal protein S18 acetylase RimI-like enzyme
MIPFAFFDLGPQEVTALLVVGAVPAVAAFLAGYVARQAKRRGYSFWLWFFANFVTLNPLLVLIVLAVLPDARKMALRRKLLAELEAKLARRPTPSAPPPGPAVPALSVGDQPTVVPPHLRSIGDEETRA